MKKKIEKKILTTSITEMVTSLARLFGGQLVGLLVSFSVRYSVYQNSLKGRELHFHAPNGFFGALFFSQSSLTQSSNLKTNKIHKI